MRAETSVACGVRRVLTRATAGVLCWALASALVPSGLLGGVLGVEDAQASEAQQTVLASPLNVTSLSNEGQFVTGSLSRAVTTPKVVSVAIPAARTGLVYTGFPKEGVLSGTGYTRSGTYTATNVGTYTCTVSLTSTTSYRWSDGTTAPKRITWSISKATPTLSVSTPVTGAVGQPFSVPISYNGDGVLTATSSNTSVASVAVSGKTLTVTGKRVGSTVITISASAGTNYTARTMTATATLSTASSSGTTVPTPAVKSANPVKVSVVAKSYTVTKVKKGAQSYKALGVTDAKGTVTYAKASGSAKLTVSKTTGRVTVKKGTKVGVYKIKVRVTAAGTASYSPKSVTKTVTVKVLPAATKVKSTRTFAESRGSGVIITWSATAGATMVKLTFSTAGSTKSKTCSISKGKATVVLPSSWRGKKVAVTVTAYKKFGGAVLCGKAVKKTAVLR